MDQETATMAKLVDAFKDLDADAAGRVLRWAFERYGLEQPCRPSPIGAQSARGSPIPGDQPQFGDLATLYDSADPSVQTEKALVVAYWFQVVGNQEDWESQLINTELKNLGHGVKNITDVLNSLTDQKPRLVLQTKKSGTSKQARKRYKLTLEGIRRVEQMLRREKVTDTDQ